MGTHLYGSYAMVGENRDSDRGQIDARFRKMFAYNNWTMNSEGAGKGKHTFTGIGFMVCFSKVG